jgi:serine/threonine protein kinase
VTQAVSPHLKSLIFDALLASFWRKQTVGTIGYIPSEVLADPKVRSPLQDVYACGVMLYEAVARRRPDPVAYMPLRMLGAEFGVFDPIVSDAIASIGQRMTSAAEFADRLSTAQQGVAPEGWPQMTSRT